MTDTLLDVVVLGAGPAGLSAALALGRARRRVLVLDAGTRRNARASHVQNFLTRDGTPPLELRALGRRDLERYRTVEVRDARVEEVSGERDGFVVRTESGERFHARRVLLATGLLDESLPIEGFEGLWGHGIVQCPYCHGWESSDRPWGYLAPSPERAAQFTPALRAWTDSVTLYTNGEHWPDVSARLEPLGIQVETSRITRLVADGTHLSAITLADERERPCELLFAHPPQRLPRVVAELRLEEEGGFVAVDAMTRETSRRGIYAAGDLVSRMQAAIAAAASGAHAAAVIVHDLFG
jgi:thioredoxin reductase